MSAVRIGMLAGALLSAPAAAQVPTTALPRSSPERQGISSAAILSFIQRADTEVDALHSVMVLRHGHVVAEAWWHPYDAATPHMLYSLSKSFTSTAVGLLIAEGKLSLDDQVLKFFPQDAPADPSPNLRSMRVRDLLRMNTGHDKEPAIWSWTSSATSPDQDPWVKTFLTQPVPFKPGSRFLYNSPATYMLSAIVQRVTGTTVLDYLRPRLFEPLGIEHPIWPASPQGVTVGAFGLSIRTEDIARFGQLYLQRGVWHGRQLIPASWVAAATAMQTSNGSSPESDWDQGYGYQFWRSRHNSYRGDGAFGQYCLILPDVDAVVVITGGVRDMQAVMNIVWQTLLPALRPRSLPENADGRRRLTQRLTELVLRTPRGSTSSPVATAVSSHWYRFPENERGIEAAALEWRGDSAALLVRTAAGETRTPIGLGDWRGATNRGGFTNGIDQFLSVPAQPLVAASGAWTADSVFTLKLALYETPYGATLTFRFDRDRLVLDAEYNVSFGPTKSPQLIGELAR